MIEAWISGGQRTPIAALHGELSGWHPVDLLAHTIQHTLETYNIAPTDVDLVVVGCAMPVGAQAQNMARAATLALDWPHALRAHMVEAGAGSGLQAVTDAVAAVRTGSAKVAIAAAVDVMSLVPDGASALARNYGKPWGDAVSARFANDMIPPVLAAERWCEREGVTAEDLSNQVRRRLALEPATHILPTSVLLRDGSTIRDERRLISADTTRKLSTEPPKSVHSQGGLFTADLIAPMGDGAAAVVLNGGTKAEPKRLRLGAVEVSRTHPFLEPFSPVLAAQRLLATRSSHWLSIDEPTAATAVAIEHTIGIEPARPGPLATARPTSMATLASLVDLLHSEAESGLLASELGPGLGLATLFERG